MGQIANQTSVDVPYPQGTYTIIGPDGQRYQVPSEAFAQTMGGPPPQPPPGANIGGTAGQMAGVYVGQQMMTPATGAGAAGASAAAAGSPALGSVMSGSGVGAGTAAGGGTLAFPSAQAATAAGYTPVAATAEGGVLATPAAAGASPLLGAAGIAAGAYTGAQQLAGAKNVAEGKDMSWQQKAALALPTFGASLVWDNVKGKFGIGDGDKYKTESRRLNSLVKGGVYVPENLLASMPKKGRSYDELVNKNLPADFIGRDDQGNWVNNKFAKSRDVADLRPEDIVNYSAFAEKDREWFNKPLEERLQVAQSALASGAVSEGKGSINVNWDKMGAAPAQAPAGQTDIKVAQKDPGRKGYQAAPTPQEASSNPVQKPVPKAGALSLRSYGSNVRGMMAPPPSQKPILGRR